VEDVYSVQCTGIPSHLARTSTQSPRTAQPGVSHPASRRVARDVIISTPTLRSLSQRNGQAEPQKIRSYRTPSPVRIVPILNPPRLETCVGANRKRRRSRADGRHRE
jgi:hypothetical protein